MSANNQSLLIKHGEKYLAFTNVQAESWSKKNEINISDAKMFVNIEDAIKFLDKDETEYGIGSYLLKDGSDITIIEG